MGNFRVVVQGVGPHGCDRGAGDGESIQHSGCRRMDCPDCLTREFVEKLMRAGLVKDYQGGSARFIHWPGESGEVVDDLLNLTRQGNFPT